MHFLYYTLNTSNIYPTPIWVWDIFQYFYLMIL
nr:MAG TPA: hypothetical protein [Caudoviricetes sp.]